MRKIVGERALPSIKGEIPVKETQHSLLKPILLGAIAYVICVLVSIAPLYRAAAVKAIQLPTTRLLLPWGSWLPVDIHLTTNPRASQVATHIVFFLTLMALTFVIYGFCALAIQRQAVQGNYRNTQRIIWIATIIAGGIFIITPAMLSHDIYAYIAYGRLLSIYHTNPYFMPFTAYPNDPYYIYNDWKHVPLAYGPVWEAICGIGAIMTGAHIGRGILIFRILAFLAHLANGFLIALILRTMGRSPRTVTLGTLLYLWNPLMLEESSFGGHNDAVMVTLILLGIFYIVKAEQSAIQTRPRLQQYLAPIVAFALAILVKFSALPLLGLYLIYLASKAFHAKMTGTSPQANLLPMRIRAVVKTVLPAGIIGGMLLLILYTPFWAGYNLTDIAYSFTATPSSASSYGSFLFTIIRWVQTHDYPPVTSWKYPILYVLSMHLTWNIVNAVTLLFAVGVGIYWLWRAPTARTLVLSMTLLLAMLLVVANWFFPWYLTWLMGPMMLCLPVRYRRLDRALLAFTIAFTFSTFSFYLYAYNRPPFGGWSFMSELTNLGIPLLVFVIFMRLPLKQKIEPAQLNTEGM